MKWYRWLGMLGVVVAGPLAAQDTIPEGEYPWRTSHFPYVTGSPNDGVMGLFRLIYFRQARFEDRVSLRDAVAVEGGYSTHSSWLLRARGDFPRIADGWRLEADAQIGRTPRFGNPEQYQERESRSLNVEITRRIRGPLILAARIGVDHSEHHLSFADAYSLYPNTPFTYPCDFIADPSNDERLNDCSPTISQSDARGRLALVLDFRDREFDTQSGALLEAGIFSGSAGEGYHGSYGLARGWLSLPKGTRLTARAGFRSLSKSAAIAIQHEIPGWENPVLTLGGPQSQRGLGVGEETGRGALLGGVEARKQLKYFANGLATITAIAFVDGGRTFRDLSPLVDPVPGAPIPTGDLKFTFDRWEWSFGGGLAIRVLKDARLSITAAKGKGETRWYLSSGWSW